MIDLSGYSTLSFPVACKTGVFADSRTGFIMVLEDGDYVIPGHAHRVNKRTMSTYYTSVWSISGPALLFTVLRASSINKQGLQWCEEFEASFLAGSLSVKQKGAGSLAHWLNGDGSRLITPGLLIPSPGEEVTPELCVQQLWHKPQCAPAFAGMAMRTFVDSWMDGSIEKLFDPVYGIKHQKFGLEIEFTGMTRRDAAEIIARYFGTSARHVGGYYDMYSVLDGAGRSWHVMFDGSIEACTRTRTRIGYGLSPYANLYSCELVTPLCEYDDIPVIQQIVRKLRHNGMFVNQSCGIHVHVDATGHTAKTLKNLTNIMVCKEDILLKALAVPTDREKWCQKIERRFLHGMQNMNDGNGLNEVQTLWYNGRDRSRQHYDHSRYCMLNLHSLWQGKGIEFRLFNSTTHAGKVKAYIQLCLAISNQAKNQSWASYRTRKTGHEKRQFRTWLINMGLVGEEFATARLHLLANLKDERTNAA